MRRFGHAKVILETDAALSHKLDGRSVIGSMSGSRAGKNIRNRLVHYPSKQLGQIANLKRSCLWQHM
jgi:hypothetical protein